MIENWSLGASGAMAVFAWVSLDYTCIHVNLDMYDSLQWWNLLILPGCIGVIVGNLLSGCFFKIRPVDPM